MIFSSSCEKYLFINSIWMYPPNMWKRVGCIPLAAMAALTLASCTGAKRDAVVQPESEQVVGEGLKDLYMACSAAAPQSAAQQKIVLRMAQQASNGRELLLAMRAAVGVFPAGADGNTSPAELHVCSLVTAKMMRFATLDQLIEYSMQYPVAPESSRPYVQRMFQLGGQNGDPRIWYRIKLAASRLRVGDLAAEAQAKGDQLKEK
jgi:hypothetical protein